MPPTDSSHALIRRAYRAFGARDVAALRALADPEIEVRAMTGVVAREGAPYVGHEGIEDYMRDVADVWDELELEPAEFHDLDSGEVLVFGRARARRGSTLVDSPNVWLWRVRDGRILVAHVLGDTEAGVRLLRGDRSSAADQP